MTAAGEGPWVVVYDGDCTVCNRAANAIRDRDRDARFELVPYQNEGVRARFPDIPPEDFEAAIQLIGEDGVRWQGAAALEKILRILPKGRRIAWLFRIPLIRPIAEVFYRWFARNRHRFRCGEHCEAVAGAPPPQRP